MVSIYKRIRIAMILKAKKRTQYLIKHHVFAEVGKNFYFQPRIIPINSEYIKFHDNVSVATNVTFCNHDIMQKVFNSGNPGTSCKKYFGCIEIMDNVFIGANSTILYNVRIGPNAIVAAGSVVTKDVPPNSVVGGVPARVIGSFEELYQKRKEETQKGFKYDAESCWERFYVQRKSI